MRKVLLMTGLAVLLCGALSCPALAVTEAEVTEYVDAMGREAATGNIFIWFICAMAFLKVSQKIDSFMNTLGIGVGHTGGSMLAEALIAARGIGAVKGFAGGGSGGSASGHAPGGGAGGFGAGAFAGGLAGMVGRRVTNSAVNAVTRQGPAEGFGGDKPGAPAPDGTFGPAGAPDGAAVPSSAGAAARPTAGPATAPSSGGGIGKRVFDASLSRGGSFAAGVISTVAMGSVSATGTMTGDTAAQALSSYLGYSGDEGVASPSFSDVEIGGGRITGVETSEGVPEGEKFAMYAAEQYMEPSGDFSHVTAQDGSRWYKQYAQPAVEKSPYMDEHGEIKYHEKLVKRLPSIPKRKDKV